MFSSLQFLWREETFSSTSCCINSITVFLCNVMTVQLKRVFYSELDNHCRALSAVVLAFPPGCLVPSSKGGTPTFSNIFSSAPERFRQAEDEMSYSYGSVGFLNTSATIVQCSTEKEGCSSCKDHHVENLQNRVLAWCGIINKDR